MSRNTYSRTLHDLGLAAWFGGTLANAVALNPAVGEAETRGSSGRVANVGWNRWTPVNAAAIGIHLIGGAGLVVGNRGRLAAQQGVMAMTLVKTALTVAALGLTAYSRVLGKKVSAETSVPLKSGTEPAAQTPPDVANAQRQLRALQWAIPALTGAIVAVNAYAGEQQRPSEVKQGMLGRLSSR